MISASDVIAANEKQVAAKVMDGEAILINLGTGIYYSLGATGGFIWSLVEKRLHIRDIIGGVVEHYDVTESEAQTHVLRLSAELCEEGLAVTSVGPASTDAVLPKLTGARLPFEAPTIEKFTDMAEMFALDPPLPGLSQAFSNGQGAESHEGGNTGAGYPPASSR
jgi:hypothetical protein